jgi:ubiquinol-cytochrome c reductase cytochrome b subunit
MPATEKQPVAGAGILNGPLTWIDQSPVLSIRYKGLVSRWTLGLFAVAFLMLGYLGTLPVTPTGTFIAQVCTLFYFAYFLLMPWYTRFEATEPVSARLTWEDTQ